MPAYALAAGRRWVTGCRFPAGADLVRHVIRRAAQVHARQIEPIEVSRAVLLSRALWHEGTPSSGGGRVFGMETAA